MRRAASIPLLAVCVATAVGLAAQAPALDSGAAVAAQVRTWRQSHERDVLRELRDLVALPNLASDRDGIARNAAHLQTLLQRRGFSTRNC